MQQAGGFFFCLCSAPLSWAHLVARWYKEVQFQEDDVASKEDVERINAKQIKEYAPALHALARLQDQLDTVLKDSLMGHLHTDESLKLWKRLQHGFNQIKHDGDTQIKLAGVCAKLFISQNPLPLQLLICSNPWR